MDMRSAFLSDVAANTETPPRLVYARRSSQ